MIDKKTWLIAAVIVTVFAAGWWGGQLMNQPASSTSKSLEAAKSDGKSTSSELSSETSRTNTISANTAKTPANAEAVVQDIRSAMGLAPQDRANRLPKALEKITSVQLSTAVLATLQEVIDAGELNECNYVISLMEQREEKQSVGFLVKTLDNDHAEIRERALFALEAVAGNVFATPDAAKEWAAKWKPDPQRAKLFSPEGIDDEESDTSLRIPGPRGKTKENPEK
jgi:hypothetical protein